MSQRSYIAKQYPYDPAKSDVAFDTGTVTLHANTTNETWIYQSSPTPIPSINVVDFFVDAGDPNTTTVSLTLAGAPAVKFIPENRVTKTLASSGDQIFTFEVPLQAVGGHAQSPDFKWSLNDCVPNEDGGCDRPSPGYNLRVTVKRKA